MVMTDTSSQRNSTRAFYDRISHVYDLIADAGEHAIRDVGVEALHVSPGERVLEIGFGTGHGLLHLADAVGTSGHVYGVEISSGMIDVAHRRIDAADTRNVTLLVGDARSLCFGNDAFDAVFMSFTLELLDAEISLVLAEIRRVLRRKGRLSVVAMATSEHGGAMIGLYQWMHRHWPHIVDCRPIDVLGVLRGAGFDAYATESATICGLPVVAAAAVKQPRRG